MNVEIGAEAALFPEKEYISGIFFAVCTQNTVDRLLYFRLLIYVCPKTFQVYIYGDENILKQLSSI